MSMEQTKAALRRLHDPNFARRYFVGFGLDIGSGNDPLSNHAHLFPLITGVRDYDLPDGDAQFLSGVSAEEFGFVHSSHCLEHMADPQAALCRWLEALRPGGHLIVTVPDEDLYEQGVWPSTFSTGHLWSFTIYKRVSWCSKSINVTDLIHALGGLVVPLKIERIDAAYRYGVPRFDQSQTMAECAIEFVLQKKR